MNGVLQYTKVLYCNNLLLTCTSISSTVQYSTCCISNVYCTVLCVQCDCITQCEYYSVVFIVLYSII